ncbi:MAG: prepilin-type N-terminal cleavage/methylation domain-containing protein [Candidatus Didemnitutus sp.]|nr:prepilin-type N-terminal cleavage/methylation domain-containing protein [Candidatus Didemnitutus sp.]
MKRTRSQSKGFSLLELMFVLAILAILAAILLPKGLDALRSSRVHQAVRTTDTLKTALVDFINLPGGNGSFPRTEGAGIPTSGAALTGATDAAKGNGARLDAVLLAAGRLAHPLSLRMGSQTYVSTGTGNEMQWSQALQAFTMTPDAAPLRNWNGVTRMEARTSNPLLAPSMAQGANFRLDGVTNRPANAIIAYLVIVGVPANEAHEFALSLNAPQLAPVLGAPCDIGQVAYALPVNGVTDVYVYLAEI